MSGLTAWEKRRLEKLLHMGGGYVLDFSDRSFQEFVLDAVRRDIYDEKYNYASGSKANRLRAFWTEEPDNLVGQLLRELVAYAHELYGASQLHTECEVIATRLQQAGPVVEADALEPNADDRDFELLARLVRDAIDRNEPEAGLDRLHTFVVKYVRTLCAAHGVDTSRDKPLHSLFGEYVKVLRDRGLIESEMTQRILRSTLGNLEAFNFVRNQQSLAHDNPVLSYHEALLIFNNVASAIRFLSSIEQQAAAARHPPSAFEDDELPF